MTPNNSLQPVKNSGLARKLGRQTDRALKPLVVSGSAVTVAGLAGYGLLNLLRGELIVTMGIATVTTLTAAALYGVVPLGAFALLAAGARGMYGQMKRRSTQVAADALSKLKLTASNITPETIRKALEDCAVREIWLVPRVDEALTQLDEMDVKQKHLQRLIQLNDVNYLENVVSSLDEVEQYLCMNFLQVINRIVVGDGSDRQACAQRFAQVLEENRQQLNRCQDLLDDTADWVSGNSSKSGLESVRALQEVIHEQVEQLRALE